jgi:hypothetical protein
LPLDWAPEGAVGEEVLAIRDAMEEEFQRDKMISRQKSKGKRELLNLHSSINYGDTKPSARSRKGKKPYVVKLYAWVGLWVVPQAFGFCLGSFEGCCSWVLPFVFWVYLYFGFKVLGVFSCILGGGFFWDVFCSLGFLGVSSGFWVLGALGFVRA